MASSLHNTKCIFCYSKKPNVMVKYKWEALNEYYLGSIAGHHSPYLIDKFERKGFWRPEARHVHWKICYQGAKYRPKVKAHWEDLAAKGINSSMYCSFNVSLPNEVVEQFYDNEEE